MAPGHRRTKLSGSLPPSRTLVVDNGSYTLKAGFSSPSTETSTPTSTPSIIPNCLARDREKNVYIGSQLSSCKDFGDIVFRRPMEKGYIVNWEAEKEIWEHEFFDGKAKLHCDPKQTGLILTEAPNALPVLQGHCDQIVFEEFGFARYLRTNGATLNAYNDIQSSFKAPAPAADIVSTPPAEILMLIDSSYSHTTITPLLLGRPLQKQYDMKEETYLVNEIKEATLYVSNDFTKDMERTWKGPKGDRRSVFESGEGIAKDYVLPDYHAKKAGFVRDHDPTAATKLKELTKGKSLGASEDVLTLRNERFTVPELLFNPSDIGIRQSGIAQQVMDSLSSIPMGLWPGFLANIFVVGGNSNIHGFVTRLQTEIRALAPAECIVRVAKPADPVTSTWQGGANLAKNEEALRNMSVTKEEYEEYGGAWVARRFGGR
ncbi:hypothetical protein LZ554_002176 [Drepanopeziza brunnea f. sp. 'monogermtubi']|nr:hypothetical protein LZ554_002176 [Drepanopeziza brunnea f. sp. 'monogermtubi']